jgi:hypothetical protein
MAVKQGNPAPSKIEDLILPTSGNFSGRVDMPVAGRNYSTTLCVADGETMQLWGFAQVRCGGMRCSREGKEEGKGGGRERGTRQTLPVRGGWFGPFSLFYTRTPFTSHTLTNTRSLSCSPSQDYEGRNAPLYRPTNSSITLANSLLLSPARPPNCPLAAAEKLASALRFDVGLSEGSPGFLLGRLALRQNTVRMVGAPLENS